MRKESHFQNREPFLETVLRDLRYNKTIKHISKGAILADIGCGYHGELLKRVQKTISLGNGFDISVSKSDKSKKIKLFCSDLNKNDFGKDAYYTHATSLAVLEHVSQPEKFIERISKILKVGGILIITTPHLRSKPILELLSKLSIISKDEIEDHKNYFDEKSLTQLITKNKFEITKIETFELGLNLFCMAIKR